MTLHLPPAPSIDLGVDTHDPGQAIVGGDALAKIDAELLADLTLSRASDEADPRWRPTQDPIRLGVGELVPGTRFQLERWIGEGGMGQVFEAVHVDIQRRVALKVISSKADLSPEVCAAFLAEARACAKVSSRFVVDILDFGVLPDGRPFFAMELLSQTNLHDLLADGPLELSRAIPILRQVCKALAAIHEAGLVHCDIKPANVVIQTEDGRDDTVRVVDFGVAIESGPSRSVAGTPHYMAPEQVDAAAVDGRADIYALGCSVYELLTGKPPFAGDAQQVMRAQWGAEPESILARRPELSAKLDVVVSRCLAKDPDERWPNVHELEAALCEIQIELGFTTPWDDLPMPKVDPERRRSLAERMPRPAVPTRRRWWLVLVGVAVLTAGLIIGARINQPSPQVEPAADAAEATRIEELTDAVRLAASRAHWVYPPRNDPDEPTALRWVLELESLDEPLSEEARARATELRAELAETLAWLGDKYWDEDNGRTFALEYYTLALVFTPDHGRAGARGMLTPTQLVDIRARAERGEFSPAELRAGEIISILSEEDEERRSDGLRELVEDPQFPLSVGIRESLTEIVGDAPKPSATSVAIAEAPEPPEPEADATDTGDTGDDETEPERDPAAAARRVKQAESALARGQLGDAKRLFHEALAQDSESVVALAALAELHFDEGQYRKALEFARAASRRRPRDADLHLLVGDCYLKVLRYPQARAAYEKARAHGSSRADARLAHLDSLAG